MECALNSGEMKRRDQRAGWTLLEVMIVTSIIGVLALIAIPTWTSARAKSWLTVCQRNQNMIFEQMNIYCLERGKPCTTVAFPNLCAVRDALVPLSSSAPHYIKTRKVFACPAKPESVMHDYRFIRDGYEIVGIECDYTEEHNE